MGKKDDEIERLNSTVFDFEGKVRKRDRQLEKLREELEVKVATISLRDEAVKSLEGMMKSQNEQFQQKFKEITEYKTLMITTVNIAGVADINKTLNDAVKLLEDRLEALGLKDKYTILTVPHTMSIGIVR